MAQLFKPTCQLVAHPSPGATAVFFPLSWHDVMAQGKPLASSTAVVTRQNTAPPNVEGALVVAYHKV